MPLYHGTSASSALKIIEEGQVLPSHNGFFYCFDSRRPESSAGALCFATGDGIRNGSLRLKSFFSKYAALNPNYPRGLKRVVVTVLLKKTAKSWAKDQLRNSQGDAMDSLAAIFVFEDHACARHKTQAGFINEVLISKKDLEEQPMKVIQLYIDDSLLDYKELKEAQSNGVEILPLSKWADNVFTKASQAKKGKRYLFQN